MVHGGKVMTISIGPRDFTEEERRRWNRLFNIDPIRLLAHSEIADMVARGVSIGRVPYEHGSPLPEESVWDPPFCSPVPYGHGGIVSAPLLNGENELRIFIEREGDGAESPEVTVYTLSVGDGLPALAFLKDGGNPFPPCEGETLWVAESFLSGRWATKAKLPVAGPFDPGKLVLPFSSCSSAAGKTYRFLLLDRAEYDGTPLRMEFWGWTRTGFPTGPVIDVWREAADGKRPYHGPWSGMEEPDRGASIQIFGRS